MEQRVVALLDEGVDVNGEDRVLAFFLSFWLEVIVEWCYCVCVCVTHVCVFSLFSPLKV